MQYRKVFGCLAGLAALLSCAAVPGAAPNPPAPAWDTYSDTWVGVDGLGRALPTYQDVGGPKLGKQTGIFYYLWLGGDNASGPFNNTEILQKDPDALNKPDSPLWGGLYSFHYWDEPLFGYYSMQDPFMCSWARKPRPLGREGSAPPGTSAIITGL